MKIYAASRVRHAHMWQHFRALGAPISSTWIDEAGEGETGSMAELWQRIASEVKAADRLVLYALPEDFPHKGALVEVGMALAFGKPITVCAPGVVCEPVGMRPIGSWALHPLVSWENDLHKALGLKL